jgi:predicted ferric reductase
LDIFRLCDKSNTPSKPKSVIFETYATVTAAAREAANVTLRTIAFGSYTLHLPPLGPVSLVLANLITIVVMMFYGFDTMDNYSWENIGYRAGFMTICQLPLVILLAGKQNIIGLLTGTSYERLSWYHQWISRTLWLSATIHMGFWFRDYGQYDYIVTMLKTDSLTRHGFAAWCVLTFIFLSSFAPLRKWNYEFFVFQHKVTMAGFLAAVYLHAPDEVKVWVWIPIGLVCFDRFFRTLVLAFANLSIVHFSAQKKRPFFANKATFTPLPGNITHISIPDPVINWKPGQHVFFGCHSIAPLQSHPFTIMSLPSDKKLDFLVRAERGGTHRIFQVASKYHALLGETQTPPKNQRTVFIEGPYGSIRPLRQFDTVVLFAGGMGCTFTLPLMRDIVQAWKTECGDPLATGLNHKIISQKRLAATKRIRFVWVIKSRSQFSWLESWFRSILEDVQRCRQLCPDFDKEIELSVYLTCDETLEKFTSVRSPEAWTLEGEDTKKISFKKDQVLIQSIPTTPNSTDTAERNACGSNYTCCCITTVENEEVSSPPICNCSGPAAIPLADADNSSGASKSPPPISLTDSENFRMISGRPHPRTLIRNALERAEGESAVVVCGPNGLAVDVRQSVVSLSDERAVHKGTGAQGIYLHVEHFGW